MYIPTISEINAVLAHIGEKQRKYTPKQTLLKSNVCVVAQTCSPGLESWNRKTDKSLKGDPKTKVYSNWKCSSVVDQSLTCTKSWVQSKIPHTE